MKKVFFLSIAFLSILISSAQNGNLEIKGTIEDDSTSLGLAEVTVSIYEDGGSLIQSVTTSSIGKYRFTAVPTGKNYNIKFFKSGYVSKYFLILSDNIPVKDTGNYPLEINASVFKGDPDKYYFLSYVPVAIGRYSKSINNFEWDMDYIEKIKELTKEVKNKK